MQANFNALFAFVPADLGLNYATAKLTLANSTGVFPNSLKHVPEIQRYGNMGLP